MSKKKEKVYAVTISRVGVVHVKGVENEEGAMNFAMKLPTSKIVWDDEWEATDAVEEEDAPSAISPADI